MRDSATTNQQQTLAQQKLKRAFVLTSFGYFEQALAACEDAAALSSDEVIPRTVQGAILSASGRPKEAMKSLTRLHRSHRQAILPALYLAEACFLAGRGRRAWKVLDGIDPQALLASPWADFAAQLRETWQQLEELDELPTPLVVPLDDQDGDRARTNAR